MKLVDAQLQFGLRYYAWAKTKATQEIRESFPHFQLFKGGMSWKYYQFMKRLNANQQALYLGALLKVNHQKAAVVLGESITSEEQSLLNQFRPFNLTPCDAEKEAIAQKKRGKKTAFATKAQVRNVMIIKFVKAFEIWNARVLQLPGYPDPLCLITIRGWIIRTDFHFFERGRSRIEFNHLIASEKVIDHLNLPDLTVPAVVLATMLTWINLCHMRWDFLSPDDIEPACGEAITLCHELFNELPRLLDGISVDAIEG